MKQVRYSANLAHNLIQHRFVLAHHFVGGGAELGGFPFFDLDVQETLLSVSLTALMQVMASFALAKGLNAGGPMSLIFSR